MLIDVFEEDYMLVAGLAFMLLGAMFSLFEEIGVLEPP
jgi:hypothetical protein